MRIDALDEKLTEKIESTRNELSEKINSVHERINSTNERIKHTNSKMNLMLVFMGIGFSGLFALLGLK